MQPTGILDRLKSFYTKNGMSCSARTIRCADHCCPVDPRFSPPDPSQLRVRWTNEVFDSGKAEPVMSVHSAVFISVCLFFAFAFAFAVCSAQDSWILGADDTGSFLPFACILNGLTAISLSLFHFDTACGFRAILPQYLSIVCHYSLSALLLQFSKTDDGASRFYLLCSMLSRFTSPLPPGRLRP
jgi:hypothetical protein